MKTVWRPPVFNLFAMTIVSSMVIIPVAMVLVLHLELTPIFVAVAAIVVVVPIVEVAIMRRRMADVWDSQRRLVPPTTGGIDRAIEAALREAGLTPTRRHMNRTPMEPEREVLDLANGLNVTVITAPRGHVVYVGPDRDATRSDVERVKAAVDVALARPGAPE